MKKSGESTTGRNSPRGFTLIESLVVIGIIGVLVGLILPAVQGSREASRRASCANNLGQLIRATLAFESSRGGFPPAAFWGRPYTPGEQLNGIFSAHCALLPFLEQKNVYNSINFDLLSGSFDRVELVGVYQRTAATQMISVFLCPSDPNTRSNPFAPASYRACTGLGEIRKLAGVSYLAINDGAFAPIDDGNSRVLPLSSFRDGLSNTLAFSEKPVGSGAGGTYHPFRDWVNYLGSANDISTADQWANVCSRIVPVDTHLDAGGSWMIPGAIYSHFYASAPPNTRLPDCGSSYLNTGIGIFAARSYHRGGVNAAMADGSARWFSSSIDVKTWRSLGTRAGGEVLSE